MIIENIFSSDLTKDPKILANLYIHTKGSIADDTWKYVENNLLSDKVLFLHSGSWRFDKDAVYIENDYLQNYSLNWHPNTKFSHDINKLLPGLVRTMGILDILMFHPEDLRYKTLTQIEDFCDNFKKMFVGNISLQVITSMTNICINRLCYNRKTIEDEYNVKLLGNDIVWVR